MVLKVGASVVYRIPFICFNPCFAGYGSKSGHRTEKQFFQYSFNPCFAGYGSKRNLCQGQALRVCSVSILVLLDMVLKDRIRYTFAYSYSLGFNPCFAGYGSKSSGQSDIVS